MQKRKKKSALMMLGRQFPFQKGGRDHYGMIFHPLSKIITPNPRVTQIRVIRMQHWRRPATDGAGFWLSCSNQIFSVVLTPYKWFKIIVLDVQRRHIWQLDAQCDYWFWKKFALAKTHIVQTFALCDFLAILFHRCDLLTQI